MTTQGHNIPQLLWWNVWETDH